MPVDSVSGSSSASQFELKRGEQRSDRSERLEQQRADQKQAIEDKLRAEQERLDSARREREMRAKDDVRGQNLDVTA